MQEKQFFYAAAAAGGVVWSRRRSPGWDWARIEEVAFFRRGGMGVPRAGLNRPGGADVCGWRASRWDTRGVNV